MAHDLYITLVHENQRQILFKFKEAAPLNPEALPILLEKYGRKMKFINGKEPAIKIDLQDISKKELLSNIKNILHDLKKLKSNEE